jgi:hypothetical protein
VPSGARNCPPRSWPCSEQKTQIEKIQARIKPSDDDVKKAATEPELARRKELDAAIKELNDRRLSFLLGLLATDQTNAIPDTRVLYQGNHKDPREAVVPGFLSALDPNPAVIARPVSPATTGRRLTLANWIASPENPLTARVLVNRVWLGHFGRGLVNTPNDFGLAGDRPTHPELLDWLASEFMAQGWSVKKLHRLIVTSATYRQRSSGAMEPESEAAKAEQSNPNTPARQHSLSLSAIDPDNTLYWRQNLRRHTAEQLRDAILFVSGRLNGKAGGGPVWPERRRPRVGIRHPPLSRTRAAFISSRSAPCVCRSWRRLTCRRMKAPARAGRNPSSRRRRSRC